MITRYIDTFQVDVPFLYPLKTSEKHSSSNVFWGYKNAHWSELRF